MSYKFFENRSCEFYPCHKAEEINCLFCFCPLYYRTKNLYDCGGNFKILSNGVKDCRDCNFIHTPEGYDNIIKKLKDKN